MATPPTSPVSASSSASLHLSSPSSSKIKTFVLDTNVLLHDPDSLEAFKQNHVVLGMPVIEELDRFKTKPGELGTNARTVIRKLDSLRDKGHLKDGVPLENGGICSIVTEDSIPDALQHSTSLSNIKENDQVLRLAFKLHKAGERVILVSKDISTRIKADALGIKVEDYENKKVNTDNLFVGFREVDVDPHILDKVRSVLPVPSENSERKKDRTKGTARSKSKFEEQAEEPDDEEEEPSDEDDDYYSNTATSSTSDEEAAAAPSVVPSDPVLSVIQFRYDSQQTELLANEFMVLRDKEKPSNMVIAQWKQEKKAQAEAPTVQNDNNNNAAQKPSDTSQPMARLYHLSPRAIKCWNCEARSKQQMMALEILQDPKIKLVTLIGQAGTGKTLLALAAALDQVFRIPRYERILVTRPVMPMGKDIGYLPGGKDEKLLPWMQPIFDNLAYLCVKDSGVSNFNKFSVLGEMDSDSDDQESQPTSKKGRRNSQSGKKKSAPSSSSTGQESAKSIINSLTVEQAMKKIQLEALAYIRGRSIMNQFIIVDECQNLTPHEIKTIISRCGNRTKIVLCGDPYQIDNPYLDVNSNGLSYCVEKLKKTWLHGHVTLERSERSQLAAIAAKLL